MKRKIMTLVLCLLAALALVSVGFASWVISVDAIKELGGNVQIDTVVDKRLEVKITEGETPVSSVDYVFGGLETVSNDKWLKLEGNDRNIEKLTHTFTITITDLNNTPTDAGSITAVIEETSDSTAYKTAENAGYVKALPEEMTLLNGKITKQENKTGVYKVTITLEWGGAFGNQNPYTFYNNQGIDDPVQNSSVDTTMKCGDHAAKHLKALESLKDAKFKLTFTIKPAA